MHYNFQIDKILQSKFIYFLNQENNKSAIDVANCKLATSAHACL